MIERNEIDSETQKINRESDTNSWNQKTKIRQNELTNTRQHEKRERWIRGWWCGGGGGSGVVMCLSYCAAVAAAADAAFGLAMGGGEAAPPDSSSVE